MLTSNSQSGWNNWPENIADGAGSASGPKADAREAPRVKPTPATLATEFGSYHGDLVQGLV